MDITIHHPWMRRPVLSPAALFPSRILGQRFGEGILEADLFAGMPPSLTPYYYRTPSIPSIPSIEAGLSEVKLDKEQFSVLLDVKHFSPEEMAVKVVGDYVEVHAKHEERQDEHGFISREFHRRYKIPASVNPASITSALSTDGLLSIQAPVAAIGQSEERSIPIARKDQ
ncbi:heat shock protein beta-6 [Gastrophryne carolinensis]